MTVSEKMLPSYSLWSEPWIGLERKSGGVEWTGIGQALVQAHDFLRIYEQSPLVIVGIQRLLTAILQAVLKPQFNADLEHLWKADRFPEEKIRAFAGQYEHCFDLFSAEMPFLQSADLALKPVKGDPLKTVAYLMPELPSGTAITHYRHGAEENQVFCPRCAAGGLTAMPAFATSGGAGIKPSINGVPPLYLLPGGNNLFESLLAGLVTPGYMPRAASRAEDRPWWERAALVKRGSEVSEVGYLHSLTFPARRVRLHPEHITGTCTRCGASLGWGVRTMVYEMGECRPDGAVPWFDPFAAYRLPDKDGEKPVPIRPVEGKAAWREFSGLFLRNKNGANPKSKKRITQRPLVLDQIAQLFSDEDEPGRPGDHLLNFRCVGLRTDMKAKVFEWVDAAFDVPLRLMRDQALAGFEVDRAIELANDCAIILSITFREEFNPGSRKSDRAAHLRTDMVARYWTALAVPFREFILTLDASAPKPAQRLWGEDVLREARRTLLKTLEMLPDDAATLRKRVLTEQKCLAKLNKRVKEAIDD
jgi:CRISPR system Cascade subunit CasA